MGRRRARVSSTTCWCSRSRPISSSAGRARIRSTARSRQNPGWLAHERQLPRGRTWPLDRSDEVPSRAEQDRGGQHRGLRVGPHGFRGARSTLAQRSADDHRDPEQGTARERLDDRGCRSIGGKGPHTADIGAGRPKGQGFEVDPGRQAGRRNGLRSPRRGARIRHECSESDGETGASRHPEETWTICGRYRCEDRPARTGGTMNNELGVWTYEDCALVLIDYQKEIFDSIRSESKAELVELNVRLLARTAKAFNMPIVLSTVGVGAGINGPTRPSILSDLPGVQVIDRVTMNAFDDRAFSEAVKKTGRKRLVFGGLHTEICLTFAVVEALKGGYESMFVVDAVGGRSQTTHRTAIERLTHAGAVPNTALAVLCEAFRDWTSPQADKAREVIAWYFAEIPKVTADFGV